MESNPNLQDREKFNYQKLIRVWMNQSLKICVLKRKKEKMHFWLKKLKDQTEKIKQGVYKNKK